MSDVEQTVSEETPAVPEEVNAPKSATELSAEVKRERKTAKHLANHQAMLAGPQAPKEVMEEEDEEKEDQITPWDLANHRRLEKQKERGGSLSELRGKTVHYGPMTEPNNKPSAPIKRHSISDATKTIRWITETGRTNRQMKRAQDKLDRAMRGDEARKEEAVKVAEKRALKKESQ